MKSPVAGRGRLAAPFLVQQTTAVTVRPESLPCMFNAPSRAATRSRACCQAGALSCGAGGPGSFAQSFSAMHQGDAHEIAAATPAVEPARCGGHDRPHPVARARRALRFRVSQTFGL